MNVASIKRLPKLADKAVLQWFKRNDRLPHRKNSTIFLPKRAEAYFYPLKGGSQFLFTLDNSIQNHREGTYDCAWFGGTDEVPFFVPVQPQALTSFLTGGEESFFEVLKPSIIKRMELVWGKEKTLRQGDIFAYPMPYGWDELFKKWQGNISGETFDMKRDYEGSNVFRTNHRMSGLLYTGEFWMNGFGRQYSQACRYNCNEERPIALGEGTIESKKHKELKLTGLHLISRTSLLVRVNPDNYSNQD